MTYIIWKERETKGSLFEKALSLKAKNMVVGKRGFLSKYIDKGKQL